MKTIKYIITSAVLALFLVGCDAEQASQDTAPIIGTDSYSIATFSLSGGDPISNEGDERVYVYDVTLDKPLRFDHDFNFEVLPGTTATLHEDYELTGGTVPNFGTTTQLTVTILNDQEVEEPEFLKLRVISGPAVADSKRLNPDTKYPELNLTINNFIGGDLDIGMNWAADNGSGDDPRNLADLILNITDANTPYNEVVLSADGGDFEHVLMTEDTPDGDYYVVAEVYSMDDSDFDIDIEVTFDIDGVIQGAAIQSPKAMSSRILCDEYVILAKITKTGGTYDWVTENATLANKAPNALAAPYVGTHTVLLDAWADYSDGDEVVVEAGANPNELWIRNYSNPAVANPDTSYMIVTINDNCGNVTVTSNEDFDYGCETGVVTGEGIVDLNLKRIDITNTFSLGDDCGGDYTGQRFVLQLP